MAADENKATTITVNSPFGDIVLLQKLFLHLRHQNRFNLEGQLQEFVAAINTYATRYAKTRIPQDTKFFRARLHPDQFSTDQSPLPSKDVDAPPKEKTRAGRLNPEGIPYLYLGNDEPTAVAEVRPWLGARITVAEFELTNHLDVVDLTSKTVMGYEYPPNDEPPPAGAHVSWRQMVSSAFSIPYRPQESIGYVPTQYLAEMFKINGLQGVLYGSSLNPDGHNLAVFDPSNANQIARHLILVKGVSYDFKGRNWIESYT